MGVPVEPGLLRDALAVELTDEGVDPGRVIDELVAGVDPGLVGSAGPRYFGFVTGQALPAAMAADMLASVWDQNAFTYVSSPAAAVVEEIAAGWLLDVLGLPPDAGVGFVTGAQMANTTCLMTARNVMLARAGWDIDGGLFGAPPLRVIAGAEAHVTVFAACRFAGLPRPELVPVNAQGALERLELEGPAIVCAQAGNVNSGAFDDLQALAGVCREHGAWLHVDGAFGLWAAASSRRALLAGFEHADSWAADAHKWLNVPYDSGLAIVRDAEAMRAAMGLTAAYLTGSEHRQNFQYTPEASRRARGFAVYCALRSLGRHGLRNLVDRCCDHATSFAQLLSEGGAEILNDVVLNQVVVACDPEAVTRIQQDGTCWAGATHWRGRDALRISVSGYGTTREDVERSARAILACL